MKLLKRISLISAIAILLILTACSGSQETSSSTSGGSKLQKVTFITNWFPEPEHGGQYAALTQGYYKDAGIDLTIQPGGPQVSSTQIVSSGKALFGMAQADDILVARKKGIPLVAIAAIFQTNPQGLVYHKDQNIKSMTDLNGRTVYIATAASYWDYLKDKFHLDQVKEMAYTGSLTNFVNDPKSVTQGYLTAEPYTLKKQGVETGFLLNADSGYNPYANVLFTTEQTIKDKPELVKAFIQASIKGWGYYKDHYEEVNKTIHEKNPDMSLEAMKYGAETQKDLVYGEDAATKGVGYMSKERWNTLMDQMVGIKLLDKKENANQVFTDKFLPSK